MDYVENTETNLRYISKGATRNKEQLIIPYPSKMLPSFNSLPLAEGVLNRDW